MGLIDGFLALIFGGGRNVVRETAEVFTENAEAAAGRAALVQTAAMTQFGQEFLIPRKGLFDRIMDGVNRLPRPALALGTLGLFISAMFDPVWFAERMAGIALVPEPMWWLLGAIVSFYFGARHQAKGQEFQKAVAQTMAQVPMVVKTAQDLEKLRAVKSMTEETGAIIEHEALDSGDNPALEDWRRSRH